MLVHRICRLTAACEEAIEFYREAIGFAETRMMMRFKEKPEPLRQVWSGPVRRTKS